MILLEFKKDGRHIRDVTHRCAGVKKSLSSQWNHCFRFGKVQHMRLHLTSGFRKVFSFSLLSLRGLWPLEKQEKHMEA